MSAIEVKDLQVDASEVASHTFLSEEVTDDLGNTITKVYLNGYWVIAPTKKGLEARTFTNTKSANKYWNKCINNMFWLDDHKLCDNLLRV